MLPPNLCLVEADVGVQRSALLPGDRITERPHCITIQSSRVNLSCSGFSGQMNLLHLVPGRILEIDCKVGFWHWTTCWPAGIEGLQEYSCGTTVKTFAGLGMAVNTCNSTT
jgi:hypothetical protein